MAPAARTALAFRLALLHHPLCHHFHDDGYRWGPVRVCRGCIGLWMGLLAGALAFLPLLMLPGVGLRHLLVAGLALGLPQAASYLVRFGNAARAAVKIVGGIGLVWAGLSAYLLLPGLGWRVLVFTAAALAMLAAQWVRWRRMTRRCDTCPWNRDWEHCPGFNVDAPDLPPPL